MTSLRLRIALVMVAVAVIATVVVGLVTGRVARDRLVAEVDRSLEQASVVVIRGRADALRPPPRLPRLDAIVLPERTGLESVLAQVVRTDGVVVRSNSDVLLPVDQIDLALLARGGGERFRTVELDGERYRLRTVALNGGWLQTARSLTETERVLDELRVRTLWWTAAIALVAASGGMVLARGITGRLGRLSRAAEELTDTADPGLIADLLTSDISTRSRDEVTRLSQSFGRMVSALAQSKAEQERLVQDAGHELRTPLTSLRTNVDVLARYPDVDEVTRLGLIDDLRRDVDELAALVNEIIDVAAGDRNDEGSGPLVLARVVADVVERFRRRSGREVEVVADDSVVLAGRHGLERAVTNLLDNAHKFDTSGGVIVVRVADGRVEVSDRGPGVPPAERQHVFERFHRTVAARTLPGSGLGLAIVREVVERHGGTVHIADRPGGGAVIGFALPLVGRATAPETLTALSPASEPSPTWTGDHEGIGGMDPRPQGDDPT